MSWKKKYKWFIRFPGEDYAEFYPEYDNIVWKHRIYKNALPLEVLDTEITVHNENGVFRRLWDLEISPEACVSIDLKMQKSCGCESDTYADRWYGYIKFIKSDFDGFAQRVSFTPETVNEFTPLIENWATEIDLLTQPRQRVFTYADCELVYLRNRDGNPLPDYWQTAEYVGRWDTGLRGTNPGQPNYNPNGIIYGEVRAIVRFTGTGLPQIGYQWFLSVDDGHYYRQPYSKLDYQYDTAYFNDKLPNLDTLPDNTVMERLRVVLDFDRANGVLLKDAIQYLFSDFTVVSNYFNINPDGTEPVNSAYTFAEDYLHTAVIFRESTVLLPLASDPATSLPVEAGKFIEDLLNMDVKIWYDFDESKLRIEHVSYARFIKGIDLIETRHEDIKKDGFRFTRDVTEFPRHELFKWAQDNESYKLQYSPRCALEDGVDVPFNLMSGNLLYMYENDKLTDNGGFVIVAVRDTGELYAEIRLIETVTVVFDWQTGELVPVTIEVPVSVVNEPFKISQFIQNNGYWNRPLLAATDADGNDIAMNSRKPTRSHEITFGMNCDNYDNDFAMIKKNLTPLGWGEVTEATYKEREQSITLKQNY